MDPAGLDLDRGVSAVGPEAPPSGSGVRRFKTGPCRPMIRGMKIDPISPSAATREVEREVLVIKKTQDVEKQIAESLIDLVKDAPAPAPGRIDSYA